MLRGTARRCCYCELENFRDYDLHFVTPIVIEPGREPQDRLRGGGLRRCIPVLVGVRAALRHVTRRVAAVALGLALIIPAPSTAPVVASAAPGGGPPPVATPSSVGPAPVAGPPVVAAPPVVPLQARTTLVSRTGTGDFPDNRSVTPSISADGRYVAYSSFATDIRPPKAGAASPAIFVYDTVARTTIRLPNPPSLRPGGTAIDPSISGKGEVVAFTYQEPFDDSGANKGPWVVAWTRATNRTTIVSRTPQGAPVAGATEPSVSANARFVAYTARNADIVPRGGNDANVVRYDLRSHRTVVVSIGQRGSVSPGTRRRHRSPGTAMPSRSSPTAATSSCPGTRVPARRCSCATSWRVRPSR